MAIRTSLILSLANIFAQSLLCVKGVLNILFFVFLIVSLSAQKPSWVVGILIDHSYYFIKMLLTIS
jgi:hypothetical protein